MGACAAMLAASAPMHQRTHAPAHQRQHPDTPPRTHPSARIRPSRCTSPHPRRRKRPCPARRPRSGASGRHAPPAGAGRRAGGGEWVWRSGGREGKQGVGCCGAAAHNEPSPWRRRRPATAAGRAHLVLRGLPQKVGLHHQRVHRRHSKGAEGHRQQRQVGGAAHAGAAARGAGAGAGAGGRKPVRSHRKLQSAGKTPQKTPPPPLLQARSQPTAHLSA